MTAFGRAAALNLDYQRAHRVLPFPFHFLNNNQAMNVKPRNYSWREFYEHVIDLTQYSFSPGAIFRRFGATSGMTSRSLNLLRAVSTEGFGRLKYFKEIRARLDTDRQFVPYFEQETAEIPEFYTGLARKDLGFLWEWLPADGMNHDPCAYLKSERSASNLVGAPVTAVARL